MRKPLTIALLALYVVLSAGVTILLHTCGGETVTMLVTTNAQDPCGCGDESPADKCCTTEVTTVKLSDEQKANIASPESPLQLCGLLPLCPGISAPQDAPALPLQAFAFFSPPPDDDLNILHSVLRL